MPARIMRDGAPGGGRPAPSKPTQGRPSGARCPGRFFYARMDGKEKNVVYCILRRFRITGGGDGVSDEAYEIIALLMRYVFVLIGGLIVWRAYRWLRRDARAYKREMRSLPDAGLVGEVVNLGTGKAQPLPREGTIGSSRECDIRVKGAGVQRRHARFEFEEGKGLRLIPGRGCKLLLGDQEVRGQGYALHGTQLQIGDAVLRVRLFAGLKVPRPAAYQENPAEELGWVDATPENLAAPAPGFPALDSISSYMNAAEEDGDVSVTSFPPPVEAYDGHYTEDGQMTWQYAYSLEELQKAMESQAAAAEDDGAEGLAYQSPLPARRRRRDRHA